MNAAMAKALRAPFPREQIGHLPKAGITLDYVGHAATTDRLLNADPSWTWEPMGRNQDGSPVLIVDPMHFADKAAKVGIWISLLIGDTATPGFGEGKNIKEAIGDAIRNAAMRRGVALDLWSKEDLQADVSPVKSAGGQKQEEPSPVGAGDGDPVTNGLHKRILELADELGANRVTVQKSINDNRGKNTAPAHLDWCGRQIKTMEANVAAKAAEKASPFQPPADVKDKAA